MRREGDERSEGRRKQKGEQKQPEVGCVNGWSSVPTLSDARSKLNLKVIRMNYSWKCFCSPERWLASFCCVFEWKLKRIYILMFELVNKHEEEVLTRRRVSEFGAEYFIQEIEIFSEGWKLLTNLIFSLEILFKIFWLFWKLPVVKFIINLKKKLFESIQVASLKLHLISWWKREVYCPLLSLIAFH